MIRFPRWVPAALGVLALGAAGSHLAPRAGAQDAAGVERPATWVFDVRVVRVDTSKEADIGVGPTWKSPVTPEGTTTTAWADLLATLKTRGTSTILLEQRVTSLDGVQAAFKQGRKRPILAQRGRVGSEETWETAYAETGVSGDLTADDDEFRYRVDASWEETPDLPTAGPIGNAVWTGSSSLVTAGETLVLSHRQQRTLTQAPISGLEIYVFVTATNAPR